MHRQWRLRMRTRHDAGRLLSAVSSRIDGNWDGFGSRFGGGGLMERDIGLALSGGGSRGAAFPLGCLRALYDRGLLPRVRVISGVSGGALLAALYAYGPVSFDEFDAMATEFLRRGFQWAIARRFLTSLRGVQAGLGIASLPLSGAVAVARYLAEASGLIHSTRVLLQHSPAGLRQVNRTTAFVDVLDEKVFGGRTMQQISHAGL